MITTVIYVRVSTTDQELENQIRDLTAYSLKNNWEIYNTYSDVVTGQETREYKRPGFNNLFKNAHKKLFLILFFLGIYPGFPGPAHYTFYKNCKN